MDFVAEKVQEWGFENFVENFRREQIDEQSFKLLDMDTLKVLIPPTGPRLKFAKLLAEYKSSLNEVLFEITVPTTDNEIPVSTTFNDNTVLIEEPVSDHLSAPCAHTSFDLVLLDLVQKI